jgi:hypothetical protein
MKHTASLSSVAFAATLCLFLLLGLIGILHHEMWRDELEIWLIARDSGSLRELFENIGTQGHPSLWYLIVFALTCFTSNPLSMQLLHLVIGAANAALFLRFAPFGPWLRILFCFGYFSFYEYTIISRNYGLMLLLVFTFCALFERRRELHPWLALVLFLLAHTHIYGTIIAANLGLFLFVEAVLSRGRVRYRFDGRLVFSVIVFLSGVATALAHVFVQSRHLDETLDYLFPDRLQWITEGLSTVFFGYVPLPDIANPNLWNTNVLHVLSEPAQTWAGVGLSLLLLLISGLCLRRTLAALSLFVLGAAPMLIVVFFFWYGSVRHYGQIYLLFVTCCWLAQRMRGDDPPKLMRIFLSVLFVLQAGAAVCLYAADLSRPFANPKAAAEFLEADEFKDTIWLGSVDFAAQSIAVYVERQIYFAESNRFGTFVDWGKEREPFLKPQAMGRLAADLARQSGKDVMLILNYEPFALPELGEPSHVIWIEPNVRVIRVKSFQWAIVPSENYFLFRLQIVSDEEPG